VAVERPIVSEYAMHCSSLLCIEVKLNILLNVNLFLNNKAQRELWIKNALSDLF